MTLHLPQASTRFNRPWRPVLTALILIIGVLCAWFLTVRADREMREDLLARTQLVAGAVNLERIQALTGTEADLESSEYLRFKEQFAAIRAAEAQCRFIYLMGRRADGTVFFFVDSEPAGSEDESPAGMIYGDAPDAFHRVFTTGVAAVEGPFTDSWGTFVSGAVPVTGPQTGAVLAVLAMDIEVRDWRWNVAGRAILPVGLAVLALIAIVFAGAHLLAHRARTETPPRWMWHLEPALFVAVGLVLTLFAAWLAQEASNRNQVGAFRHLAESRTAAFAEVLRSLRDIEIEGLAKFYENSERVPDEKFQDYVSFLTRNPAIQAWGWVPAVPSNEKDRFERAARAEGMDGFIIWERDAEDHRIPADGRDVYYPVFRGAPDDVSQPVIGYDLGSDSIRRQALDEALRTGFPTATEPVRLQESGRPFGMLVFRPVFADAVSRHPRGIALAVLRLEVALQVVIADSVMGTELLLIRGDQSMEALASSWAADSTPNGTLSFQRPVLAFGKTFLVTAHAGPDFLRAQPARGGLIAALLGLWLTAAVAVVVSVVLRRRQVLEGLVRERTAALRKSENLIRRVFEILPIGLWIADKNGKLMQGNPAGVDIWGMEPKVDQSEYGVFKARRLPSGEEIAPDDWALAHTVNKGETIVDELLEIDAFDGKKKIILNYTAPVLNEEGKVEAAIVVNQDISSRYHAEQALLLAKEQAEAANVAKSEFLANMSHELRTPFNGIMGMMQLLQTTALNDEQQEYVTAAITSSERFTRLLSDILDLSSIEAGKMVIFPAQFDLGEMLESISGLFEVAARQKGIALECSMEADVPERVLGDAARVKQVLFNLVGNALKFTEKGTVRVHLSTLSAAKDEDARIMFSISDTGIGIPDHKFKELFQPFTQVDGSYTRAHQGAGLGLVIVRRLVALMDGNITVESEVGQGTTVHMVLPFNLPARDVSETARAEHAPGEAKNHLNILLAEDDPLNQLFMQSILKKLGHAVTLANNGHEALDFLKTHNFDCILMDIQMPVMTGDEATKAIRESTSLGSKRNIPIIAVTAHTQPGDRERFLASGMNDYLGKPVGVDGLENVLNKYMRYAVKTA